MGGDVFEGVNGLPGWLYALIWPVQQLGVLVIGPVVALAAALTRHNRVALATLLATVAKARHGRPREAIVSSQRPGTSIGGDIKLEARSRHRSWRRAAARVIAGVNAKVTPATGPAQVGEPRP